MGIISYLRGPLNNPPCSIEGLLKHSSIGICSLPLHTGPKVSQKMLGACPLLRYIPNARPFPGLTMKNGLSSKAIHDILDWLPVSVSLAVQLPIVCAQT